MGLTSRRSRTYVMDAGRAFQLREQVVRRHRLVMAICALALLVFACVVIAMVLKYELNKGSSAQDGERELHIRGGWGVWLSWSSCTQSCGGGQRQRRRYCNDPQPETDGKPCDGRYELTAPCSNWPCPDCGRTCKTGVLKNCTYCACTMTSLRGHVRDVSETPVNDVGVFLLAMQWYPLSKSTPGGDFIVNDVCPEDRMLIFKKPGYKAASLNATGTAVNTSDHTVILQRLVRHRIITHPQDTTVFEGSSLTLTCRSNSKKVKYEWFKDDNILSLPSERSGSQSQLTARAPQLVINNVQDKDSGVYRCRVLSEGGMVFSHPAVVKVLAPSVLDNCQPQPEIRYHHIPPYCSIHGIRQQVVDIGFCRPQSCATRTPPKGTPRDQTLCCGPVRTNMSHVDCEGWSYPIVQTLECGCSVTCGVNMVDDRPVSGQTYLYEPLDGATSQVQAILRYNNRLIETSKSGSFTLTLPSNISELVIDVPSGLSWNPTVQMTPVSAHTDHLQVVLQSKASPIRVHSSRKMVFPVMSAATPTRPVVSLVLPGGAIVDHHGNIFNGTVDVYTQFLDPRSEDDILNAPGSFEYLTEEGQLFHIELFGIVLVYVESTNGTALEINSGVVLSLNIGELNKEYDIKEENMLRTFILNHDTGQWKPTEDKWTCNRPGDCLSRLKTTIDVHSGVRFILAARPILNQNLCTVKVSTFQDSIHKEPIPGHQVQVLSTRHSHYIHVNRGVTDTSGSACLNVPCGADHVISAPGLSPSSTHYLPQGLSYSNDLKKNTATCSSENGHLVRTGDGPVHLSSANTCGGSDSKGYQLEFVKDRGTGTELRRWHANRGTLMAMEPLPHLPHSWYSHTEGSRDRPACLVKVLIQGVSSKGNVYAISRLGSSEGPFLGTYSVGITPTRDNTKPGTTPDSSTSYVCLQVRCPAVEQDNSLQSTHVTLYVEDTKLQSCQINVINEAPYTWEHGPSDGAHTSSSFLIHPFNMSGITDSGGYFQAAGRGSTAEEWAMYQCITSTSSAATLTCGDPP